MPGNGNRRTRRRNRPAGKARLVGTRAIAPANAPAAVKRVIAAANRIRTTPYIWGGGHGRWQDSGYDCSGAVSYALHGGKLLTSPLTSGSFESFGEAGAGRWITIYANASHAYMVVAGLRFDTAGDVSETGPRWHPTSPPPRAAASSSATRSATDSDEADPTPAIATVAGVGSLRTRASTSAQFGAPSPK